MVLGLPYFGNDIIEDKCFETWRALKSVKELGETRRHVSEPFKRQVTEIGKDSPIDRASVQSDRA